MRGQQKIARLRDRSYVALISVAVILCGACATGPSSQTKTGPQTLIVDQNFSYDDLDPALGALNTAIVVDKSVYDTLMTVNPRDLSKPYPSLATSFTVSPDAKTTTFQLRHGVKFASGNPFTSADVVWSLTRLNVVGLQSGLNLPMTGLTVSAPDPFTVVFTSDTPNPAVAMTMTISNAGILDSVLLQQHGGTDNAKDKAENFLNSGPVGGTGPYMIQFVDRTSQIVLKANPNYWGPKPVYSTVIFRNAPSATQAFDIQDGQAQIALDISAQAAASLNSSAVNVILAPTSDQLFIALNADPSVTKWGANQNFRDAVRYGLDYQGLVALAGNGAVQATGFIPNGFVGSLPLSDAPHRDLALAKADLAKAEQEVGATNPALNLNFATDFFVDGLSEAPFATKVQSDLKEVGITVNLAGATATIWDQRWSSGTTQMFMSSNLPDYPDPADYTGAYAVGGSDTGYAHWVPGMDPAIDALTTAALNAITTADRGAAYQALEMAMNNKAYFDWILQPGRALITAKSVHAAMNPFTLVDLGSVT